MPESVEVKEVEKDNSFFEIRDYENKLIYTTNVEELKEILTQILMTGVFIKEFEVFKDLFYLTFQTISEKERIKAYDLVRIFTKDNEDTSRAILDTYSKNVNIASQLIRIKIKSNTTQVSQGTLEERILLLEELNEDQLRSISKYLMIFATLTAKAFNCEEAIKNS
jgi:hypothetical protein